uniref:Uncharacterized protein n=1 Tax=Anopheles merus TaxID=30066 RepID=A0A182VEX0_ANOME
MHGIQHLFRQHALEKQASADSWHSANSSNQMLQGSTSTMSSTASSSASQQRAPNERSHSIDESQVSLASEDYRLASSPRHIMPGGSVRSPTSPQEYYNLGISIPRGRKSPESRGSQCSEMSAGANGIKRMSKRMPDPRTNAYNPSARRGSLESACSPPNHHYNTTAGYFPHDLDDIYEYKTDHQYFTHTGAYHQHPAYPLTSDHQRNLLFQRNHGFHSLDEYASSGVSSSNSSNNRLLGYRNRFDNSSFARKLTQSISQSSIDSGHSTASKSSTSNNNGHEKRSREKGGSNSHHHHHSITEMIKHLGKKAHIWPGGRTRHSSISEDHHTDEHRRGAGDGDGMIAPPKEDFRSRSRSLDVDQTRRILDDCESTYKIYNKILREGKTATAAHMRRASAELAERRRASLGATRGLRADGTLDPYHAAILFRDSRGAPHD